MTRCGNFRTPFIKPKIPEVSGLLRSFASHQIVKGIGDISVASSRLFPFSFIVIIEAEAWLMAQPCPVNLMSCKRAVRTELRTPEMNLVAARRIVAVHEHGSVARARRNFADAANDRG